MQSILRCSVFRNQAVSSFAVTVPTSGFALAHKLIYWRFAWHWKHFCSWRISSYGRVQNTRGIIGWGYKRNCGYYSVNVKKRGHLVHRLVAFHFIGPPPSSDRSLVHHKDGNRGNNHCENLEYVTHSENLRFAFEMRPSRTQRVDARAVRAKALESGGWMDFASVREAADTLGMSISAVYKCYNGDVTSTNGYRIVLSPGSDSEIAEGEDWRQALHPTTGSPLGDWMVSTFGRVQNSRGRIHTGTLTASGYRRVSQGGQNFYVHRLVAYAFLGRPSREDLTVNHKDGDRGNNSVDNLEYLTIADNIKHSWSCLFRKGPGVGQTLPVVGRRCGTHEWTWYPSCAAAARALGVNARSVALCRRALQMQVGGFEFKAAEQQEPAELNGEDWREVDTLALDELKQKYVAKLCGQSVFALVTPGVLTPQGSATKPSCRRCGRGKVSTRSDPGRAHQGWSVPASGQNHTGRQILRTCLIVTLANEPGRYRINFRHERHSDVVFTTV